MSFGNAPKRPRGRPLGSGRVNDGPTLKKLAVYITDHPTASVWCAIPEACGDKFRQDTHRRRLYRKWKADGTSYMKQVAEERVALKQIPSRASYDPLHQLATWERTVRQVEGNAFIKAMRDIENSPMMRMLRDIENNPIIEAMRDIENSPVMRAMRALENDPAIKAAREFEAIQRQMTGWDKHLAAIRSWPW